MKGFFSSIAGYFRVQHLLLLVPIGAFAIYDSVFSAFSSVLAVLWEMYPDVSRAGIQMVLALPSLTSVPTTLLTGFLASYVHKKTIAEVALVFLLIGGLVPVAVAEPHIGLLFASSALIGVGQGLLHPLASMLVCQYWDDKSERSRVLGFKQALNYLGAAVVSLLVGFLALAQWNFAYLIYVGVVPVLVISASEAAERHVGGPSGGPQASGGRAAEAVHPGAGVRLLHLLRRVAVQLRLPVQHSDAHQREGLRRSGGRGRHHGHAPNSLVRGWRVLRDHCQDCSEGTCCCPGWPCWRPGSW